MANFEALFRNICLLSHNYDIFVFSSLGIFASADAAYVLAYSVIMLTTDLHSDQVGTGFKCETTSEAIQRKAKHKAYIPICCICIGLNIEAD